MFKRNLTPEGRRRMSEANIGNKNASVKRSAEYSARLSERMKGTKYYANLSQEQKLARNLKISKTLTGKKLSLEHKNKISEGNLGKQKSLLTRQKMSKAKTGARHPRWKGGYENTVHLVRQRRILKLSAEGSHTLAQWQALKKIYNDTCPACGLREPIIKLTEDHITPLINGGSDYIDNIQPLCRSCNSKKRSKTIKYGLELCPV